MQSPASANASGPEETLLCGMMDVFFVDVVLVVAFESWGESTKKNLLVVFKIMLLCPFINF